MKFAKAREGEKFVFAERGGLWVKTGDKTAEMAFPTQGRKCSDIDPELNVYVIFEKDKAAKTTDSPLKITMVDRETQQTIVEIPNATPQQMSAYSYAEGVAITPKGKRKQREYDVDEVLLDHDNQTLLLVARDVTDKDGSNIVTV